MLRQHGTPNPTCFKHAQGILFKSGDGTQSELTRLGI
ncbi:rCG41899, isoform CRA_b [Rattus norvegicus]|uniref:RCG41899, isoform CRA_b n=1 Tax=Rattus norvegicus TaxID=10116 RepID=A6KKU1_RAT|nr:rCG41899, isoform CRA_b [Rattus norvegicus]